MFEYLKSKPDRNPESARGKSFTLHLSLRWVNNATREEADASTTTSKWESCCVGDDVTGLVDFSKKHN